MKKILIVLCLLPVMAFADSDLCDKAYNDGKALYQSGQYAQAQKKFLGIIKSCKDFKDIKAVYLWIDKCVTSMEKAQKEAESAKKAADGKWKEANNKLKEAEKENKRLQGLLQQKDKELAATKDVQPTVQQTPTETQPVSTEDNCQALQGQVDGLKQQLKEKEEDVKKLQEDASRLRRDSIAFHSKPNNEQELDSLRNYHDSIESILNDIESYKLRKRMMKKGFSARIKGNIQWGERFDKLIPADKKRRQKK